MAVTCCTAAAIAVAGSCGTSARKPPLNKQKDIRTALGRAAGRAAVVPGELHHASMADWRLYWLPQSSAALRVVLALRAKQLSPANTVAVTVNTSGGDGNMFVCPGDNGETVEYRTISPEGRVPSLRVGTKLLTQAAAILEYMEDAPALAGAVDLMPANDPWARARVRQVCWLLGADTHPLQNMGMLRTAVADFGLPVSERLLSLPVSYTPAIHCAYLTCLTGKYSWQATAGGLQTHPFRQHYMHRALAALDGILGGPISCS